MVKRVESVQEIIDRGVKPEDLFKALTDAIATAKWNVKQKGNPMSFDRSIDKFLDNEELPPTGYKGHCVECDDFYFDDECEGCKAIAINCEITDNVRDRLSAAFKNGKK